MHYRQSRNTISFQFSRLDSTDLSLTVSMEIIDPLGQSLRKDAPSVTRPMRQSLAQSQRVDTGSHGRNVVDDLGNSRRSVASKVNRMDQDLLK